MTVDAVSSWRRTSRQPAAAATPARRSSGFAGCTSWALASPNHDCNSLDTSPNDWVHNLVLEAVVKNCVRPHSGDAPPEKLLSVIGRKVRDGPREVRRLP